MRLYELSYIEIILYIITLQKYRSRYFYYIFYCVYCADVYCAIRLGQIFAKNSKIQICTKY